MSVLIKGVYDQLITAALREKITGLPPTLKAQIAELGPEDAIEYLARHIAARAREFLTADSHEQLLLSANALVGFAGASHEAESAVLLAVHDAVVEKPHFPLIPLAQSALVTNDQGLNYHTVLRSEIATADRIDFVCPFIGNQGLNLILDVLAHLGNRLRVITTTYLGATNQHALERIARTGAQVKIVYERSEQKTGLHAKAWIFHRDTGYTTGTVGSSNVSPRALVDGLEWNVRLSSQDAPQVLEELMITFERLWEDPLFEDFDPGRDTHRLQLALKSQRADRDVPAFFADLQPHPHQQEALHELAYARLEGKTENLIVAATGTGKTLLAAFDYQRLCSEYGGLPTLLFVAHREDILLQSLGAFRAVLRNSDFGELNVGMQKAEAWKHVFASIQSFSSRTLQEISPTHFDIVVIDEFHHAEAPTYLRLLDHFHPRQLIGLTATPERSDGKDVLKRFGAPTYELRLWHALERRLLSPFHYLGIDDETDLRGLSWMGGRYADAELDEQFIDNGQQRADIIVGELLEKAEDLDRLRAVAFCASIRHANFMSERFRMAGLDAQPLHSGMPRDDRSVLMRRFRNGDLPIICTVDLFNEGVDIPEINTVLFLRPTESATVFIQQLGRGLRNHPDKGALLVLDFVGQQNLKFRMDMRYRSLTGLSRTELERALRTDFPMLPPGCHIRLDRTTKERVLKNIRDAIPTGTRAMIDELRRMHSASIPINLSTFLQETGLELSDVYRNRSFNLLKFAAGLAPVEVADSKRIGLFIHLDDRCRIEEYRKRLTEGTSERALERMLAYPLMRTMNLDGLDPIVREEMLELLSVLGERAPERKPIAPDLPFSLHSQYSRDEIVAPFRDNPESMRQGTFYVEELELDIHIVTLRKSERDFSPTTRYADYFIAPDQLHWESQSTTTQRSPTGQRLIKGLGRHLFFVREDKVVEARTSPFMCLGFARPISQTGEKPIKLTWKLNHTVPDQTFIRFRAAAG